MNSARRGQHHGQKAKLRQCYAALLFCVVGACANPSLQPPFEPISQLEGTSPCEISASDREWLGEAVAAWGHSLTKIAGATHPQTLQSLIFDANCLMESRSALVGGAHRWSGQTHNGQIRLPSRNILPLQVTSFAAPAPEGPFFVMAAPSVWQSAGVNGGGLSLEQLTTAVMLHEAVHVLQFPTYGNRISKLAEQHRLPENFSDDSIQELFGQDTEFASSIERETILLLSAAAATNRGEAKKLAAQALAFRDARQKRWFSGELAYLREAEDVWLTLEGSGQWLAYQWLIAPEGAALSEPLAHQAFGIRGSSWSQKQGYAVFLLLDRLTNGAWKRHAFGDGAKTAGEMLSEALQPDKTDNALTISGLHIGSEGYLHSL